MTDKDTASHDVMKTVLEITWPDIIITSSVKRYHGASTSPTHSIWHSFDLTDSLVKLLVLCHDNNNLGLPWFLVKQSRLDPAYGRLAVSLFKVPLFG